MNPPRVLTLPDWRGGAPGPWLGCWEQRHGYQRVEQHDWARPLRGDWITRLEETLLAGPAPAVLVAQGLGCILVAAWASISRSTGRVRAALLVAPADVESPPLREQLHSWSPVVRQRLPFASTLVARPQDGGVDRAAELAQAWGSHRVEAQAGAPPGDWPEGHAFLQRLLHLPNQD